MKGKAKCLTRGIFKEQMKVLGGRKYQLNGKERQKSPQKRQLGKEDKKIIRVVQVVH